MKRFQTIGIILLSVFLAVFGIAIAPGQANAADDGSVHVGTGSTGGQRVVTDVMRALKIDKKHGLNIKWAYFPGPRGMQALMNGRVEVANLGAIPAARMTLEGRHMVNFEIFFDSHISFLVPPESKIKDFWELKGKKLGIVPRASAFYTSLAVLTGQRGLDVEKTFKLIIGNPIALRTFLQRRDVAAIMFFEPFTTAMTMSGVAREIINYEDLWLKNTHRPLLFVTAGSTKKWLDANPKTARKLAAAIAEARQTLFKNPGLIKHGLKAIGDLGNNPRVVEALKTRMIKRIYKSNWNDETIAAGRWLVDQAVKLGQLKERPKQELFVNLQ